MAEPHAIDPSRRTLQLQVTQRLRDDIVSGVFAAGEKLNEVVLARAFGTSRGTVREALRKLEQEGLLSSVPHRGTFVRKLDATDIIRIYQVRAALETLAARTAASLNDEGALERLESRLREIQRIHRNASSFRDRVHADLAFHEAICEASDNPVLLGLWRSLTGQITAMMMSVGSEPIQRLQNVEAHRELLEAIRHGDPIEITDTFERHFARSAATAVAQLQSSASATSPEATPEAGHVH